MPILDHQLCHRLSGSPKKNLLQKAGLVATITGSLFLSGCYAYAPGHYVQPFTPLPQVGFSAYYVDPAYTSFSLTVHDGFQINDGYCPRAGRCFYLNNSTAARHHSPYIKLMPQHPVYASRAAAYSRWHKNAPLVLTPYHPNMHKDPTPRHKPEQNNYRHNRR